MNNEYKLIGGLIQLAGLILCLVGAFKHDPAFGGIGVLVALIGRVIAEKLEDWIN